MNKGKHILAGVLFIITGIRCVGAQEVSSASDFMVAQPVPDRTVHYNVSAEGVSKPITWGLDLAWLSTENIRRGMAFMGQERIDVIRSSFIPTEPLIDGELQGDAKSNTILRINIIKSYLGTSADVVLNCDHPSVHSSYLGNAANWAELIDVTTSLHQAFGLNVVSVAPFNEPDYGWGQYTGNNGKSDFYNVVTELGKNARFDNIRICGGNTLNCDEALSWYNYINPAGLEEGNTHQLAGSFDTFAAFFEAVRANGDHATDDELHNVMEAMVGVEYGMQTGIWWGTAELARGEFVKASDGVRLGYAEHRPNWTAASVYRSPEGKIQAFGGTSERQAATTTYRFVSQERDVFYDGYGPQREYTMVMPGGTGYQQGQTNAERVVNITWGDDIQPVIDGQYVLVNRNSGKVMEVASGSASAGANIQQGTYSNANYQRWNVTPVDSRIGGDFSYFTFTAVHSGKSPDVQDFSLENNANVIAWDDTKNGNQQWYLEYAEDGWFYIRSRHSAKCMHVASSSTANGANIMQYEKNGATAQQWRFLPVDAMVEFDAPSAPESLKATPNSESVKLEWTASTSTDIVSYTIFRSETAGGSYNTIARGVTSTAYVDNTATSGGLYYYVVKAVDKALNRSDYSNEVSAMADGNNALVAFLKFDENTKDNTGNLNHGAVYGAVTYVDDNFDAKAIALNGDDAFVKLSPYVTNQQEISITTWVNWDGGSVRQHIFDFGNNEEQYMYLTPLSENGKMRFAIKNTRTEQGLNTTLLFPHQWSHVAITLGSKGAKMYLNGALVAQSEDITISPMDFKPILNYIGRSQFSNDPLFEGYIDDFRIYNYELSAETVEQIAAGLSNATADKKYSNRVSIWPLPVDKVLNISYNGSGTHEKTLVSLFTMNGMLMFQRTIAASDHVKLDVTELPSGLYMLKSENSKGTALKKVIIQH